MSFLQAVLSMHMSLITSTTVSSSVSQVDFTSGITSTYKAIQFRISASDKKFLIKKLKNPEYIRKKDL